MLIALGKLLYQSYQFLGHGFIADLILILIGNISDSNDIVRLTSRMIWRTFITVIQAKSTTHYSYSYYNNLMTVLNDNFMCSLNNTYKIAEKSCGHDTLQLREQLQILLGYGICVKDHHLSQLIRITGNELSSILSKLFMYDITAIQIASILETRKYYNHNYDIIVDNNTNISLINCGYIESGYYRISWKYFHDAEAISAACQLAVLMGRNGKR